MSYRYCDLTSDDDFPYSCEYSHREIGTFRSMKRFVIDRSHTVRFANVVAIPVDSQRVQIIYKKVDLTSNLDWDAFANRPRTFAN